jgi:hypothetical protein
VPALQGFGQDLSEALKDSGCGTIGRARTARVRRILIIAEVALSLVLVIGAGLLIKSFARLIRINPGFRVENLITARISLPESQYRDNHRVVAFYRELLGRVRAAPGVRSTGVVSRLPLSGGRGGDPFSIEGRPYDAQGKTPQVVNRQVIAGDYFRTMQIPLIEGRFFGDQEREPVAIINATMAQGFWPGDQGRIDLPTPRLLDKSQAQS